MKQLPFRHVIESYTSSLAEASASTLQGGRA